MSRIIIHIIDIWLNRIAFEGALGGGKEPPPCGGQEGNERGRVQQRCVEEGNLV